MATNKVKELSLDENVAVPEGEYDSKQKYVTVTSIQHTPVDDNGAAGKPVNVPPDVEFSQYADNFSDEELNAFVAQGTIAPLSDVNADISDQNDALRSELENTQAENEELNAKVAELQAQLEAANKPAN